MMHNPDHLVALAAAAQAVVEKMDTKQILTEHYPGYLVVMDGLGNKFLTMHVSPMGHICDPKCADLAKISNSCLLNCAADDPHLLNGRTSGEFSPRQAGSVGAAGLAIGYASRDGRDTAFADEAVAIMIAIKARILPKTAVRRYHEHKHGSDYNAYLRILIDNITWTD